MANLRDLANNLFNKSKQTVNPILQKIQGVVSDSAQGYRIAGNAINNYRTQVHNRGQEFSRELQKPNTPPVFTPILHQISKSYPQIPNTAEKIGRSIIPPGIPERKLYSQKVAPFLKNLTGGLARSLVEQDPQVTRVQEKQQRGEALTPEDRKIVQENMLMFVGGVTDPLKIMPQVTGKVASLGVTRTPSKSMVAAKMPMPGFETKVSPSLTKIRSSGEASKSMRYVLPSQLYKAEDSFISSDYTKVSRLAQVNVNPFIEDLTTATGIKPNVRVKKQESFEGKIQRYQIEGKDPSTIADTLAGRVITTFEDIEKQIANIQNKFKVVEVNDFFKSPTEFGYKGINIKVELPNGQLAEIQLHTPESVRAADQIHKIYEKWRNLDVTKLTPEEIVRYKNDLAQSKSFGNKNTSTNTLKAGTDSQNPIVRALQIEPTPSRLQQPKPMKSQGQLATLDEASLKMGSSINQGNTLGQKLPETKLQVSKSSSLDGSIPRKTTDASPLNVKRLDLDPAQQERVLESQIKEVREVLSNKEVLEIAKKAGFDTKTNSLDQTARKIAEQLNVRRQVTELENKRTQMLQSGATDSELQSITQQIQDISRISREQGTSIAQQLSARRIIANEINTPMQRIFQLLDKAGVNPDVYTKAAARVDFNNVQEVVDFYRKYAPASAWDWIDLVRYNSMLSSPNTFINNFVSNLQGSSLIAPIEKTIVGTLDVLKTALTGKPRRYAVGEGVAYAKGYIESVGKSVKAFLNVLTGDKLITNLDFRQIPLSVSGSRARKYEKILEYPMKTLEATDQFFTTLATGGEEAALNLRKSKGITIRNPQVEALANAEKRLFRSKLGDNQGSRLLDAIDTLGNTIQGLKSSKNPIVSTIAKYSLPFVRTPTNVLKQGLEYSPFGLATLPGASNKTELLAKTIMGTSIATGTAMLLASDRLTFAEPVGEKQKNAFRAAGMQPYSVKIGDNWVSYSKLHPAIAFNLALVAAVKNAEDNQDLDESQVETILNGASKWLNFFADQSYVKSIGDLVAATKGDVDSPTRIAGNYAQQLIPFRALMGWVTRLTDPYQRQADKDGSILQKQFDYLKTQIPILSMTVPARLDQFGNPIENQNRKINAWSPARITTENPTAKEDFKFIQEKSRLEKEGRQLKEQLEKEAQSAVTVPQASAAEDEYVPGTGIRKLNDQEKERVDLYLKYGKSIKSEELVNRYLGEYSDMPTSSKYLKAIKDSKLYSKLNTIQNDEKLSQEQKDVLTKALAKELSITPKDLDYYSIANDNTNLKTQYVLDNVNSLSGEKLYTQLVNWRKPVNNQMILSDAVIDNLVLEDKLSEEQGKALKKIDHTSGGKVKTPKLKGKKPKKITIKTPKYKPIKLKTFKPMKIQKPKKLKFKKYKPKKITY